MTTPTVPESLLTKIRSGNRFLLTSHVNPDGDAIGSELGLARMLRKLGKGATVWNHDATPRIYAALPGAARIHVGEEPPAGFPDLYTAVIVLECPTPERTGLAETIQALPLINVDHHLGNELYGEVNWVDPAAPAVGEMVYRLSQALKIEIDEATANALFLTLVTDTGGFRFSNTTAETFDAGAALVRAGASPETVGRWIYESQPLGVLRLLGEMIPTLSLHDEGRVATARLEREMFARAAAERGDSEGLIDHLRAIAGVEAVALFRQVEEGWKVSLRSRGDVDVERIARKSGGGGHQNAAGFTSSGELATLEREIVAALAAAVAAGAPAPGDAEGAEGAA